MTSLEHIDRKTALVTGAAGFIGYHISTRLLTEGWRVIGVDCMSDYYDVLLKETRDSMLQKHRCYRSVRGKIETPNFLLDLFQEEKPDIVIHLAANADVRRSIQFPDEYWKNNVEPTTKIQRQCYFNRVPLLYASSSCIHSWAKSPYGTSKKVNEETAFPGQVALRFTTVYGEGARESMFIGKLMRNEIQYATNHIRDFIHVVDLAEAHVAALNYSEQMQENVDVFNVGTGEGNTVLELINTFEEVNGVQLNYEIGPRRDGDIKAIYTDTSKINIALNWKSRFSLIDSLKHSWEWEKNLRGL